MVRELEPEQTRRAQAFRLWMKAPMPMLTFFKTLDVTRLVRLARHGFKFNALMCWCIGKAAEGIEEFYMLPVGDKLLGYDELAVSTVVALDDGDISTCDIPFSDDLVAFHRDYMELTEEVRRSGQPNDLSNELMVIGTSALTGCELDGAVNIYAGIYNNPFLIWGKYRRGFCKVRLPISFQFHHSQMDGAQAAAFLENLQKVINSLSIRP